MFFFCLILYLKANFFLAVLVFSLFFCPFHLYVKSYSKSNSQLSHMAPRARPTSHWVKSSICPCSCPCPYQHPPEENDVSPRHSSQKKFKPPRTTAYFRALPFPFTSILPDSLRALYRTWQASLETSQPSPLETSLAICAKSSSSSFGSNAPKVSSRSSYSKVSDSDR